MRTCTLIFSIVVHALVACTLLFTTVLATDELPVPHDASTFVNVVAVAPQDVPPPARRQPIVSMQSTAAPTSAPDGVVPEVASTPLEPFDAGAGSVVAGLGAETMTVREEPAPPPAPVAPAPPVRVGGVISAPNKIVHVSPVYPGIARSARVSGVVILETTIAEDGSVRDVRVLRSVPLLDQAAVDAVRQWRFTPTLLNGRPVAVLMTVTVAFRMD
jgi:protein TonB